MTLADWQVEHGTVRAERWHYRHNEKPCDTCRRGRNQRRRAARTYAVHADRGNGTPVCGAPGAHHVGADVTCMRCCFIAGGGMTVVASGKAGAR